MKANYTKKQQAIILHLQGNTHKSISKNFDISEKTISNWLEDLKGIDYNTLLIKSYRRLSELLSNANADIKDIHNLNNVVASIEKRLKNAKSM